MFSLWNLIEPFIPHSKTPTPTNKESAVCESILEGFTLIDLNGNETPQTTKKPNLEPKSRPVSPEPPFMVPELLLSSQPVISESPFMVPELLLSSQPVISESPFMVPELLQVEVEIENSPTSSEAIIEKNNTLLQKTDKISHLIDTPSTAYGGNNSIKNPPQTSTLRDNFCYQLMFFCCPIKPLDTHKKNDDAQRPFNTGHTASI